MDPEDVRSPTPKRLWLTAEVWREGNMYTSYCRELDLASCGTTVEEAWHNLHEALQILIKESTKKGTIRELLEEAGLVAEGEELKREEYFIGQLKLEVPQAALTK